MRHYGLQFVFLILAPILAGVSAQAQTPFDIVPGGVKADYYASRDFEAYVSFRFAGESDWWTSRRVRIRRGEGLTLDGRRAKCGNRISLQLPPGAKTLPPSIHFVEKLVLLPPRAPDLVFPTPEGFYFPPELLPPVVPDYPPGTEPAPPYADIGFLIPPGGISLGCSKKNQNEERCKPHRPQPRPEATPEMSPAALIATGLGALLWGAWPCLRRRREPAKPD
jgi:hypothetical protein